MCCKLLSESSSETVHMVGSSLRCAAVPRNRNLTSYHILTFRIPISFFSLFSLSIVTNFNGAHHRRSYWPYAFLALCNWLPSLGTFIPTLQPMKAKEHHKFLLTVEIILNITFPQFDSFISIKACHLQIHANLFSDYKPLKQSTSTLTPNR